MSRWYRKVSVRAVVLGGIVGTAVLARLGARDLLADRRRHWLYNVGSLALILIPVALVAMPLLMAHAK